MGFNVPTVMVSQQRGAETGDEPATMVKLMVVSKSPAAI